MQPAFRPPAVRPRGLHAWPCKPDMSALYTAGAGPPYRTPLASAVLQTLRMLAGPRLSRAPPAPRDPPRR